MDDLHNWSRHPLVASPNWNYGNPYTRNPAQSSHMHLLWRIPHLIDWLSAVTRQIAFVPFALWPTQWPLPPPLFPLIAVTLSLIVEWRLSSDRVVFFFSRASMNASMSVKKVYIFSRRDCLSSDILRDYYGDNKRCSKCIKYTQHKFN